MPRTRTLAKAILDFVDDPGNLEQILPYLDRTQADAYESQEATGVDRP